MRTYSLTDLCAYMRTYGLTPNDLARICDINPSQMRQYALGIKNPREATIKKINISVHKFAKSLQEICII